MHAIINTIASKVQYIYCVCMAILYICVYARQVAICTPLPVRYTLEMHEESCRKGYSPVHLDRALDVA